MSEPAWVPIGPAAVLDVGPEVAYQEWTGGAVAVTATTEATAQQIVAAPAFTADGSSQYLVEFFTPYVMVPGGSSNYLQFVLYLDGVSVGVLTAVRSTGATGVEQFVRLARRLTPAAGSRTFSVRCFVTSGTGNVYGNVGGAGQYVPAFIRVTKVPSAVPGPSGLVPPTAIGTVLPASPVDGQEFILTDSLTAPTYTWHLRYMAAKASNKWLFVGGAAKQVFAAADDAQSTTAAWQALTNRPRFIVPVAGLYRVAFWAAMGAAGATTFYASAGINGSQGTRPVSGAVTGASEGSVAGEDQLTVPAGSAIDMIHYISTSSVTWRSDAYGRGRGISVTPIAVGG